MRPRRWQHSSGYGRRLRPRIRSGRLNAPSCAAIPTKPIRGRILAPAPSANEHAAQFVLRRRRLRLLSCRACIRRSRCWRRYRRWRRLTLYIGGRRCLQRRICPSRRLPPPRNYSARRSANLSAAIPAKPIRRRIFAPAPRANEHAAQLSAAVAAELCARMRAAAAYGTGYWTCCHRWIWNGIIAQSPIFWILRKLDIVVLLIV